MCKPTLRFTSHESTVYIYIHCLNMNYDSQKRGKLITAYSWRYLFVTQDYRSGTHLCGFLSHNSSMKVNFSITPRPQSLTRALLSEVYFATVFTRGINQDHPKRCNTICTQVAKLQKDTVAGSAAQPAGLLLVKGCLLVIRWH